MRVVRMIFRTIKEALKNIFRQGWLSFSAVMSMMLTLLLTSVLVIVSLNIQNATIVMAQGLETTVYLKQDVSEKRAKEIEQEIQKMPNVKETEYLTAKEAFDKQIGEELSSLNYLRDRADDVLVDQINIVMIDADQHDKLNQAITQKFTKEIDELGFDNEVADTILPVFETIRKGSFILIIAVAFVAVILISNTIRITIVARRREIEIMRLVAASNWYIRTPFIIEGILLGLIGALIATGISVGAYWYYLPIIIKQVFATSGDFFVAPEIVLQQSIMWTFGIGAFIGFIGSIFPVRKYLRK